MIRRVVATLSLSSKAGLVFVSVLAFGPRTPEAHPLPSTTLTIASDDDSLDLSISLALHELALALPSVSDLAENPPDEPLPQVVMDILVAYFARHLSLVPADQSDLSLKVTDARIHGAKAEDVGHYNLIALELTTPVAADRAVFPLTINYDAVMHEVRNHTATVLWQTDDRQLLVVGTIAFDPVLGKAVPMVLAAEP